MSEIIPSGSDRHPIPPAPVHPLAALATIVLDNVFGVIELVDPLTILLTSLTVGVVCTVATSLVQRYLAKDEWGPAIAKGLVMGIVAGVPFQVTGTVVGVPLLAWAGLHQWVKTPAPKTPPDKLPPSDEIIDAEAKDIK
jgi:hypothetical protein